MLKSKIITLLLLQSMLIQACGGLRRSSFVNSYLGGPEAEIPVVPLDTDGDGLSDYRDPCPSEPASGPGNNGCASSDDDGDGVFLPFDECPDSAPGEEVFNVNGCNKYIYFGTADLWGTAPNPSGVLEEMMAFSIFGAGNTESLCVQSTLELAQPYTDQGLTIRGGVRCDAVENTSPEPLCLNGDCESSNADDKNIGEKSGANFGASTPDPGHDTPSPAEENNPTDGLDNNPPIEPGLGDNEWPEPENGFGVPSQMPTPTPIPRGTDNEVPSPNPPDTGSPMPSPAEKAALDRENLFASMGYKTSPSHPRAEALYNVTKSYNDLSAGKILAQKPDVAVAFHAYQRLAGSALALADEGYATSNDVDANAFLYFAAMMIEAAYEMLTSKESLEVLTFAGPGEIFRNVYEICTQQSLIDGTPLNRWDVALNIVSLATGGLGSKIFKAAKRLEKIEGTANLLRKVFHKAGYSEDSLKVSFKDSLTLDKNAGDALDVMGIKEFERVWNMPKGSHPDPKTYLPKEYIEAHLKDFEDGASILLPSKTLETIQQLGREDGLFLATSKKIDEVLAKANGDIRQIERELGLPAGYWGDGPITRVNIKDVKRHNLRIPSGNEDGAIRGEWFPGGLLPSGSKEAVIDPLPKSTEFYTEVPVILNL